MSATQNKRFVTLVLIGALVLTSASSGRSQGTVTQNPQAVSQTGLLPIYGVDFSFDPSWVDAGQFPGQGASYLNFGVNASFQQVWDSLKPSGFNVLGFPLNVRDTQGAVNRCANVNNVKVVPVLTGAERGQLLGTDFSANVAAFVQGAIAALKSGDGQNLKSYVGVLAYQLEDELNHAGRHAAGIVRLSTMPCDPALLAAYSSNALLLYLSSSSLPCRDH